MKLSQFTSDAMALFNFGQILQKESTNAKDINNMNATDILKVDS